ncbi:MAG TPA: DUF559 domain-containing protein [Gammaproteobacteria bacterium]|nr:DUF559 domain-containing protein [Gammaproteobacteria bacterium]
MQTPSLSYFSHYLSKIKFNILLKINQRKIMIQKKSKPINEILLARAKSMRRNAVLAEKVMWEVLHNRKCHRYKFRRQYVIGHYIADFVCLAKKFIIEVDGESHQARKAYDARRTQYLNSLGYRVFRITNAKLLGSGDELEQELIAAIEGVI